MFALARWASAARRFANQRMGAAVIASRLLRIEAYVPAAAGAVHQSDTAY